ncbi:MAG: M14 family metallopeptidase [Parabacteroides sp.]|nr:M14 family metallopeptidase [Parabacteroides sp.]
MSDCSSKKNRLQHGDSPKRVCIVTGTHGDELEGQYVCFRLNQIIRAQLERLNGTVEIYPALNPLGIDSITRGIPTFDLDMNRIFPGDPQGAMPEQIKGYTYGIQLASFYISGDFVPHVRLMRTGYEDTEGAKLFGMPYITLRQPLPFDTTLLNYNWQIWETKAYSLYGGMNDGVESPVTAEMIGTILRFAQRIGLTRKPVVGIPDFNPQVIDESSFCSVRTPQAGIFYRLKGAGAKVQEGEPLARIIDPYEGSVRAEIISPTDGIIFFAHNKPLALANTLLFNIL